MFQLVVLLLTVLAATFSDARIINSCPGGVPLGTETTRGVYWYFCQNDGQLIQKGCLDPNGRRILVGERYVQNDYEMECKIDDGYLVIVQSGCYAEGRRIAPGEQWNGKKFWYTCEPRGDRIFIVVSGCLHENRRLRLGERAHRQNVLVECQKKDYGAIGICAIGCIHNGREQLLGSEYQDATYKYRCTTEGGWCHGAVIACLDQYGSPHRDGETWQSGDGYYKCYAKIEDTPDKAKVIAEGCSDSTQPGVIRRAGERWEENGQNYECRIENNRAVKTRSY